MDITSGRKAMSALMLLIGELFPGKVGVDRVIVSMIGRGEALSMNGKLLDDATRRKVAQNVLERLNVPVKFRKHEMSLVQIMDYQAKSLVKFLQDQTSRYWPFIAKW